MSMRFRMPKSRPGRSGKRHRRGGGPTVAPAQMAGWRHDYREQIRHQQAEHAAATHHAMCGEHDDAALCFRRAAEHGAAAASLATAIRRFEAL